MSNVLAADRKPSHFEVFDNADNIHKELTKYVLKDFAVEKIDKAAKLTEEQKEFLNYRRSYITLTLLRLNSNLRKANAIYIKTPTDYEQRRKFQNTALGNCDDLIDTLQKVVQTVANFDGFKINLNKYTSSALIIDKEINLIKDWQKSDNKVAKRLFGNETY